MCIQGVVERMDRERELFSFRQKKAVPVCIYLRGGVLSEYAGMCQTLLLVLDRREDPVTPLLKQWTYQAAYIYVISD